MATGAIVTGVLFAVLALAHSGAGETGFVRPLVAADWEIAEAPRWVANRVLRGAWHLTSIAWLAMAAIAVGAAPLVAISIAAAVSGLIMLTWLPGHPAWPLFLVAGAAGLQAEGQLPTAALLVAAGASAAACVALAVIHLYWAAGGERGGAAVVPTSPDGEPAFRPTPLMTVAVAGLLLAFAGLIAVVLAEGPTVARWLIGLGIAVLAARAVGDGRLAGFTKSERATDFASNDDRYFTPTAVLVAMGAAAALLL